MAYLKFDKDQLVNLEYSLNKEILRTNRSGSYSCSTIIGCNTRKYHGVLICPVEGIDGEKHVLLSSLDETIIQHDSEFNLGIHKYQGDYFIPKGHRYVRDFEAETIAKTVYNVGGVVLVKESLMVQREEQVIIKYTLEDAHSATKLRFRPFLAFRNYHSLTKANVDANTKFDVVKNGIKTRLYKGYPHLYLQFSKEPEFVSVPDWYYNIEYIREMERGYDYKEDLFVPGFFELTIRKGESIYFSAATKDGQPDTLKSKFHSELSKRVPRDSFKNCLINSAEQFIVKKENKTEVIAGYPWFGTWGRDTFISLPGLTLSVKDVSTFKAVVDTMVAKMRGGLFPNMGTDENPAFNSVDAPLWFFWSLQQYTMEHDTPAETWKKYGKPMKTILDSYRSGEIFNIKMHENGLIYAGQAGKALTWMDAVVNGKPVTARIGYDVEINALWYNAILFCLELAIAADDKKFIKEWKSLPELIKASFTSTFWSSEKMYLADYVDGDFKDWSVRPNQIFATALPYSPLDDEMKKGVIDIVMRELLTPRGLRTLSPQDPFYKGIYEGDQETRDRAYHQGTVWTWLLSFFCEGYLKLHKTNGLSLVKQLYDGFEEEMTNDGISSISEIYNGDPPHHGCGAISQAWSVAALLRMSVMLEKKEAL
jgi:predicted glycogen debranching enzyme